MNKATKSKSTARFVAATLSAALLLSSFAVANVSFANAAEGEPLYTSDYDSKKEAIEAGLELNEKISEEGMILVKNENKALPVKTGTEGAKVTVLGYAGVSPNAGSSANGGDSSAGSAIALENVYGSLEEAGYKLNPTVKKQYEDWAAMKDADGNAVATSDSAIANLTDGNSFASKSEGWTEDNKEYDDAVFVVLSKGSNAIGSAEGQRVHSLQLDKEQYDLVNYATSNFEKVIALVNSCTPIELKEVQDNAEVDAILMIGEPGDNGFAALGKVLNGEVNPSGHMTDTWAADFTSNPSYVNYNVTADNNGMAADGNGLAVGYSRYTVDGKEVDTWSVGYEEGIYVGYRWYETAYTEIGAGNYLPEGYTSADAEKWYDDNVVYPFGYGLSYTSFEWEVTPVKAVGAMTAADTLSFDVKVTNTGDVAGKEVVQLYYSAPYTKGGIEKAAVNLGDFAKTGLLEPGKSETVRVSIEVKDMASYDYETDKTYVLDSGDYTISIAKNAHEAAAGAENAFDYNLSAKTKCDTAVTGNKVTNQLDEVTEGYEKNYNGLSRADFAATMPDAPAKNLTLTAEEYDGYSFDIGDYDEFYTEEQLADLKYATTTEGRAEKYKTVLSDLIGAEADDPRFQDMVEQLTIDELVDYINDGGFHSLAIDYLGVPYAHNTDGPKGWTGSGVDANDRFNYFSSEPMIAATYNKELFSEMGKMIGEQGLWGNSTQESGVAYSYTGWYAPGMNIHRSPFDGRYTEYYSEDPVLTGITAANVSLGAKEKGCYITMKHFAFHNDGGGVTTYRAGALSPDGAPEGGLSAWMDEQTAREIYLKGFQICTEDGEAMYAMGSFTRIGDTWCGGSYAINQAILRDEWGFEGAVVTDIVIYNSVNAYQLVSSGGGMMLTGFIAGVYLDADEIKAMPEGKSKDVLIYSMQQTVKQNFYMVANSNAMQIPKGAKVTYDAIVKNEEGEEVELTLANAKAGVAYTSAKVTIAELNTSYAYSDITYTATGLPEGLSFDAATGTITGTPTKDGTFKITITASAEGYEAASHEFTLVVEKADPVIDPDDDKDDGKEDKGGCSSALELGFIIPVSVALVGAAVVILRKRFTK